MGYEKISHFRPNKQDEIRNIMGGHCQPLQYEFE